MQILKRLEILRADNNRLVDAHIIELTKKVALERIDQVWWAESNLTAAFRNEGDAHWKWENIVSSYSRNLLHECVALLSKENYLEGAMAYQLDFKSKIEKDKGSLYVGWLATAPRNRNWLVSKPLYKGIGSMLLYWAVCESYASGLGGRVSLQSLPTPSTVKFYENKGFLRTDLTQPETGLIDYELPESKAQA